MQAAASLKLLLLCIVAGFEVRASNQSAPHAEALEHISVASQGESVDDGPFYFGQFPLATDAAEHYIKPRLRRQGAKEVFFFPCLKRTWC